MAEIEKQLTCPKCNNVFKEPLTRFLPFTQEQYEAVVQKYGENFQICPKCNNIFNPSQFNPSQSSVCFVATAIFGSYDAPEVIKLRFFRDHYLSRGIAGHSFIALYYKIGPSLASFVKKRPVLKQLLKRFLKLFL